MGHRGGPAEHAIIVGVAAAIVIAGPLRRRRAETRRHGACCEVRSAINLVVMERCNSDLHAERQKRQQGEPEAISQNFHCGAQLCSLP